MLPTLHLASGDVKLAPIKLTIRHPLRSIMEMCMELSASKAVLPVLLSLIFHCDSDGGQFKVCTLGSFYFQTYIRVIFCHKLEQEIKIYIYFQRLSTFNGISI